jgi:hypothetical protein
MIYGLLVPKLDYTIAQIGFFINKPAAIASRPALFRAIPHGAIGLALKLLAL